MFRSLLTFVLLGAFPAIAISQQSDAPRKAIVLDFESRVKDIKKPLGPLATKAVTTKLAQSSKYSVIPSDVVEKKASELGLSVPYDSAAMRILATALGADVIVEGRVDFMKSRIRKGVRDLAIGMRVLVREVKTDSLLAGAAEIGMITRKDSPKSYLSSKDAIDQAAKAAVKVIHATKLVIGTIVNTITYSGPGPIPILINRGTKDGLREGMMMDVLRDGELVGSLRITNAFPYDCETRPLKNLQGIAPPDKIRQVLDPPDYHTAGGHIIHDPTKK